MEGIRNREEGLDAQGSTGRILDLTLAANQIAETGSNPYEVRNTHLVEEARERVRYKNGMTLPCSAKALVADAERKARHSRTLARNIKSQTGVSKGTGVDAHHIVAQSDKRATGSRRRLFGWGIAINDADNGVFLPRKAGSAAQLSKSTVHERIHTARYHLAVFARLLAVEGSRQDLARIELRDIRTDILTHVFPY